MSEKDTELSLHTVDENAEEQTVRRKSRHIDNVAKVISLLLAFVFWLFVFATNDSTRTMEQTFDVVPVMLIGTDEISKHNLGVQDMSFYNLNITLKGTRSALAAVSADNLTAYIDLSDITVPGEYTKTVKFSMPSGVALADSMQKEEVTVTVDTVSVKNFSITANNLYIESFLLGDNLSIDLARAVLSVDSVKFEAPTMLLDRIVSVRVRSTATLTLTGNSNLSAIVEALDNEGEVITSHDLKMTMYDRGSEKTQVTVSLPLIEEKHLPLTVKEKDGLTNQFTVTPGTVLVKGDPAVVSKLTELSLGELSVKTLASSAGQATVKLPLPEAPEGIYEILQNDGTSFDNAQISVTVSLLSEKTLTISKSLITVVGKTAEILDEAVTLTLRAVSNNAHLSLLETALAQGGEDVKLVADLGKVNLTGEVEVELTVVFSREFENKVYAVIADGKPTVRVMIG